MDDADWAIHEFGAADLGDKRRTDRLVQLATVLAQRPAASLPAACEDPAELKGAYRLLENPAVAPAALLAPHVQATVERVQRVPLVLAVQDTTDLDYSHHPATTGLGPIGDGWGRGLLVHTTLAITPDRLPLGVLAQEDWTRDPEDSGKKHRRKQLPISEKESHKWLTSLREVKRWAAECPDTHFVSMGDAEADIYDLFAEPRPANVDLLVRAAYDRLVAPQASEDRLVRAQLGLLPVGYTTTVLVPRKGKQPARTAALAVRWQSFTLQPSKRAKQAGLGPVHLWAVWAVEVAAPAGVKGLDWLLWTSVPTTDQAAAAERLGWYTARWGIEVCQPHYPRTTGQRDVGSWDRNLPSCILTLIGARWNVPRGNGRRDAAAWPASLAGDGVLVGVHPFDGGQDGAGTVADHLQAAFPGSRPQGGGRAVAEIVGSLVQCQQVSGIRQTGHGVGLLSAVAA